MNQQVGKLNKHCSIYMYQVIFIKTVVIQIPSSECECLAELTHIWAGFCDNCVWHVAYREPTCLVQQAGRKFWSSDFVKDCYYREQWNSFYMYYEKSWVTDQNPWVPVQKINDLFRVFAWKCFCIFDQKLHLDLVHGRWYYSFVVG